MKKINYSIAFAVLLWSVGGLVSAQTPPVTPLDPALTEVTQNARMALQDPSLTSPARLNDLNNLQAILTANRTDTRAEIEIGFELKTKPGQTVPPTRVSEFRASLKLGGPVSKDDNEPKLATLGGLSNQASLGFSLRYVSDKPEAIRKEVAGIVTEKFQKVDFRKLLEDAYTRENPGAPIPEALSTDDLSTRGRRSILREVIGTGTFGTWFASGEATYSAPETFKFVDASTLGRHEEKHDSWAATASGGWLPVVSPMPFVAVSYRYQENYESQGKRQICSPFGPAGTLACDNLVIGAPEAQRKQLAQLELRKYFPKATAAIGLRLTRDIENSVTGVELPIWVLRDDAGLLNGGVTVGWRSDVKEWMFSVFVGTPFGSGKVAG